jgi:hypothetical protein
MIHCPDDFENLSELRYRDRAPVKREDIDGVSPFSGGSSKNECPPQTEIWKAQITLR